jgi:ribosomal protein S18 acetylase RimI-like enzyme
MKKIPIRQCTHRDIDGIFQLENAWEEEGISYVFNPVSREDFMTEFERFKKYYFVAESEGRIVGYINGSVQVNDKVDVLPKGVTYFDVENLYVLPEFRDGHVGGDLLDRLLATAAQDGIERFIVGSVTKDMDRILKFYKRHGFTPWHVQFFK